jgi:superfamily II DNA or RNA helicase
MKKKLQTFNLSEEIRKYFDIQSFEHIIPWAEKNIDFSKDISAQRNRLDFDLYPYQKEVIKQWEDLDHIKTITVVAPEQMRKDEHLYCGFTLENGFRAVPKYDRLPVR